MTRSWCSKCINLSPSVILRTVHQNVRGSSNAFHITTCKCLLVFNSLTYYIFSSGYHCQNTQNVHVVVECSSSHPNQAWYSWQLGRHSSPASCCQTIKYFCRSCQIPTSTHATSYQENLHTEYTAKKAKGNKLATSHDVFNPYLLLVAIGK